MRIVPANTKPLFCRTRLPPCELEVGRVHKHMHTISNSLLTLLCKVLATMFRHKIMYLSFKANTD